MKKPRAPRSRPEAAIQKKVIDFLTMRGWYVKSTHGNAYQSGFPDLFCYHPDYGMRWVDIKNPLNYRYTKAQCQTWPVMEQYGCGVWIMVAATEEEYAKLFQPPNFRDYWKDHYNQYLRKKEEIIQELLDDD